MSENGKPAQQGNQPSLAQIVAQVWADMETKGFHAGRGTSRDDTLVRLCLVHTEVGEAAQVVKRHWAEGAPDWVRGQLADELADIVIRVADLSGCLGIDLQQAVLDKMAVNRSRPYLYGTPHTCQAGTRHG